MWCADAYAECTAKNRASIISMQLTTFGFHHVRNLMPELESSCGDRMKAPATYRVSDDIPAMTSPNSNQFLTQRLSTMKLPSIHVFPSSLENQTLPLAVRRSFAIPGRGGDEAFDRSQTR